MYNDFRQVTGVVPGRALLVWKVAGKIETVMPVILYILNLKLNHIVYSIANSGSDAGKVCISSTSII